MFGPAPIGTLDKTEIVHILKRKLDFLKVSFKILYRKGLRTMNGVILEIMIKLMTDIPMQIFTRGSKHEELLEIPKKTDSEHSVNIRNIMDGIICFFLHWK